MHHINGVRKGPPAFMLDDDAFSENDIDVPEFSPAAIRRELAKNMSISMPGAVQRDWELDGAGSVDDIVAKIGYSVDPDASVSTFDIDAVPDSPPSVSPSQSPALSPPQSPPQPGRMDSFASFRQDSLYDVPLSSEPSQASDIDAEHGADEGPLPPRDEPEVSPADYPVVQIDLSAPHAEAHEVHPAASPRASVETAVTSSTPAHSRTSSAATPPVHQHSASQHEFRTRSPPTTLKAESPRVGSAASTSALPLPSSSSSPSPAAPQSSVAVTATAVANANGKHRQTRSVGPSMLDKVISKTRPPHLPPKPRTEDRKHMHDWEAMMKRSRAAGECSFSVSRASSLLLERRR